MGTQYRVLMTDVGVRVIERDDERTFIKTDFGDIFYILHRDDEWFTDPEKYTGFIKWLTEWVDI